MSIDRLIAVRFPLAAKQKCTPTKATRAIAASVVIVTGANLHMFFVFKQPVTDGGKFIFKIANGKYCRFLNRF
jgi:hypothetical protein